MSTKTINKEKLVSDQLIARQIVGEILNFGVSQQQILSVCYLLSLELEDAEAMKKISTCLDKYLNKLADKENDEEENKESIKENAIITDF